MKIYLILILALTCQLSFAQCDTSFLLSFNQITEIRGLVSSPIKAEGTITFNKENIIIKALVNGYEKLIVSKIRSVVKKWIVCFKDGETNYSIYSGKGSETPQSNSTMSLTGVGGELKVCFKPPGAELQFKIINIKILHN